MNIEHRTFNIQHRMGSSDSSAPLAFRCWMLNVRCWTFSVLLMSARAAPAAPQVILDSGKKIVGTEIRADEKGALFLTTSQGVLIFPAGTTIVVDEPALYRTALGLLQQKRYDKAINGLQKVIEEYRFLLWDRKAERLMAAAFCGKGDFQNGVTTYERVFAHSPEVREEADAWSDYLEALLSAGQYDRLKPILDMTVKKGAREVAARAQMMRGRMNWEAGRVERALFDFMRTAELFGDVPEFQAEAFFRAGECLEKIGDPRAREFFRKVKNEFKASPFAGKAARK